MHTPMLQVIPQRHTMDCAVACLAMVIGKSYEDVLMAFDHNVIRYGATIRQTQAAARVLGYRLSWSRKLGDLETDTGILSIRSSNWKTDHLVVLKDGIIVDTDATLWDQDVFMAAYSAVAMSIMRIDKMEEN